MNQTPILWSYYMHYILPFIFAGQPSTSRIDDDDDDDDDEESSGGEEAEEEEAEPDPEVEVKDMCAD